MNIEWMKPVKVIFIIGTRPEIIKTFPVIEAANKQGNIDVNIVHSGQHYDFELSKVFFGELPIPEPQMYLEVGSGSHGEQTTGIIKKFEAILKKTKPSLVFVQGDTNTAMAGALTAAKCSIPVAHIEAGCRSFDWNMPEEVNRIIIDSIATLCFAPSYLAVENLLFEGKFSNFVFMCGNTAVDACEYIIDAERKPFDFRRIELDLDENSRYAVLTLHRFENVDIKERLMSIMKGIEESPYETIFPTHPRTLKRLEEFDLFNRVEKNPRIHLVKPQNYSTFIQLMHNAEVVLTDSGGIQVETAVLNTPCLTLRETTEWYETVSYGANRLIGTKKHIISENLHKLFEEEDNRVQMKKAGNPFEGNAGPRIMNTAFECWENNRCERIAPNMIKDGYPTVSLLSRKQVAIRKYPTSLHFSKTGNVPEKKDSAACFIARKKNHTPVNEDEI